MGFVLLLLVVLDVAAVIMAYGCFVVPVLVYRRLYPALYLSQSDPDYAPTTCIFVPCKGGGHDLDSQVEAFLGLQDARTRLFFIVESEQDGAYPIIRRRTDGEPNATLVVAGLADSCAQKNHNLLAGIEAAGRQDDVYVFLDSVTTITRTQLTDLIRPLSGPKVTVCAAFRWDVLKDKTLGERLRAFMIGLQWASMNCPFVNATWGGGTAIRRQDFETLGVADYWARTVVDDMTMVRVLLDAKRKSAFVPTCVKEMDSNVATVAGAVLWFKRQALYLKFYLKPYWLCTIGLLTCCSVNIVSFPFLLACSMIWPSRVLRLLTVVTGLFTLLMMVCCQATKRPAQDRHGRLSWFVLSPLYLVLSCCAYLMGVGTRVLDWRDVSYRLDRHGYVREILRH